MRKTKYSNYGLIPLKTPVPPVLATALGYKGYARYVAFNWTPYGDEVDYSDGRVSATGNWTAFLSYVDHPAIYPHLKGYNFGSSDAEATHVLILDQEELQLYAAPVIEAKEMLKAQWPPQQPIRVSKAELQTRVHEAIKNIRQQPRLSDEDIRRRIEEQYAFVEELQQWLDKQLKN